VPEARGGKSTVENVRLACRDHNLLAARRVFGDAVMDRYVGRRSEAAPAPRPNGSLPLALDPPIAAAEPPRGP